MRICICWAWCAGALLIKEAKGALFIYSRECSSISILLSGAKKVSSTMSATFKTVIQLSSVARKQRTESDPLTHDSARQRKTSSHSHSSSGSKHVSECMQLYIELLKKHAGLRMRSLQVKISFTTRFHYTVFCLALCVASCHANKYNYHSFSSSS